MSCEKLINDFEKSYHEKNQEKLDILYKHIREDIEKYPDSFVCSLFLILRDRIIDKEVLNKMIFPQDINFNTLINRTYFGLLHCSEITNGLAQFSESFIIETIKHNQNFEIVDKVIVGFRDIEFLYKLYKLLPDKKLHYTHSKLLYSGIKITDSISFETLQYLYFKMEYKRYSDHDEEVVKFVYSLGYTFDGYIDEFSRLKRRRYIFHEKKYNQIIKCLNNYLPKDIISIISEFYK